jgi:DNA-directed RNA polymerase specialized sigma24 family protein
LTRVVTSEEVAAYQGLVDRLARKNDGRGGAEYDDLFQEGQIAVWASLRKGIPPSTEFIQFRMSNWVRMLRKQSRREPTDYDELLPIAEERCPRPND